MTATLKDLIDSVFRTLEAKDLEGTLASMTEDVVVYDPHYPNPRMTGKTETAYGLGWAFRDLEKLGFHIDRYFYTEDGTGAAVEVHCEHQLKVGGKLTFDQVFTLEIRDGLISRFTAYEPYGPSGKSGLGLKIAHLVYRRDTRRAARKADRASTGSANPANSEGSAR